MEMKCEVGHSLELRISENNNGNKCNTCSSLIPQGEFMMACRCIDCHNYKICNVCNHNDIQVYIYMCV